MSISYYQANAVLAYIFNKTSSLPRSPKYMALCIADPTPGGTGENCQEVLDTNDYARTPVPDETWELQEPGHYTNLSSVVFPKASGTWGLITHFALLDSPWWGVGNMLFCGELFLSTLVQANCRPIFEAGMLSLRLN